MINYPRLIILFLIFLNINSCTPQSTATNGNATTSVAPCVYNEKSYSAGDTQWLKENLIPLDITAFSNNTLIAESFKQELEKINIIGIGEAVHGSHELYNIKTELTKYLIKSSGIRVVAIEIPMPYLRSINDYVNGGGGDLRELLKQTGAWAMNSEEILNFFVWVKEFNDQADVDNKVVVLGYDIPINDPQSEINLLSKYFHKVDPGIESVAITQLTCLDSDKSSYFKKSKAEQTKCKDKIKSVLTDLEKNRAKYIGISSLEDFELAAKSLNSLSQLEIFNASSPETAYPLRDQFMYENMVWIHEVWGQKERRVILWGHNTHIGRNTFGNTNTGTLGYLLDNRYGKSYYPLGSTFFDGNFNALPLTTSYKADSPPGDSYETFFNSADLPSFFIPMTKISLPAWFSSTHCLRNVGASYNDNKPEEGWDVDRLGNEFDGFIFIKDSSPSRLFDLK